MIFRSNVLHGVAELMNYAVLNLSLWVDAFDGFR